MGKDKGITIDGFELDLIDLSGIDLGPEDEEGKVSKKQDKEKLVDDYLKKMKTKADFPIFSKQLGDINRILSTEYASAGDIAQVITREISLTNKLLKLVNSSFYGNFTRDGEVKTITQAMIIVGTDQIQKASTSLIHFENMQKNSQTKELMDVSIGTFLSGMIAKNLVAQKITKIDAEEAFICSMFYNLGLHLVMFYNYEDYTKIKKLVERKVDREAASREVLGISFEELGLGVAKKWGLPQYILHSMTKSKILNEDNVVKRSKKDWLLNIAYCSNEFCSSLLGDSDIPIGTVIKKFKNVFGLSEKNTKDIIESSFTKLIRYSSTLKIDSKESELLNRVKTLIDNEKSKPDRKTIFKGIEKITEMLESPFYTYHMVLADIVDIMYDGFKYDRVLICIRDADTDEFVCRYGKGKDFLDLLNTFRFKLQKEDRSIFEIALENQRDLILPDLKNSSYLNKIPQWFSKILDTNTFVIYPVVIKGVPTGLFYADTTYKTILETNVQKNMKTLRDLALRAIKQRI